MVVVNVSDVLNRITLTEFVTGRFVYFVRMCACSYALWQCGQREIVSTQWSFVPQDAAVGTVVLCVYESVHFKSGIFSQGHICPALLQQLSNITKAKILFYLLWPVHLYVILF